ncbi:lateral organ boundaries domain-containing protein [Cynara cardunculus var. scolymus]|uniref:Lateral organ boundaries domain-containing protein n=1 Tax=Cynara cardunculus var. scolymus TaxID=59895 RepID=A0A124SGN4_CYNCS|nr:lateral organ boundaries domain-containing protein [Cynara cardunculus var. scolymus]
MTASGSSSSCGACKFLRRKCTNECVFTPYFCYSQGAHHFAAVHKVFGASNVSKLLMKLPLQNRSEAAISISYEALARMEDPIYGCIAQILALEQQEIGDLNAGLPSSFQFNNTSISDHLNQPLLFAAPHASFF